MLLVVHDRVGNTREWMGPYDYAAYTAAHTCCAHPLPFADGTGQVQVLGAPADKTAPTVDGVTASKTQLDTLQSPSSFHVRVHAEDATGAGEGITTVVAWLEADDQLASSPQFDQVTLTKTSGTRQDGRWAGDLEVPQGTPPGTYHLVVAVVDRAHVTEVTDPGHADVLNSFPFPGTPVLTVVDTGP